MTAATVETVLRYLCWRSARMHPVTSLLDGARSTVGIMRLYDLSLDLLLKDLVYARAKAGRLGFTDVVDAIEIAIKRLSLIIGREGGRLKSGSTKPLCLPP